MPQDRTLRPGHKAGSILSFLCQSILRFSSAHFQTDFLGHNNLICRIIISSMTGLIKWIGYWPWRDQSTLNSALFPLTYFLVPKQSLASLHPCSDLIQILNLMENNTDMRSVLSVGRTKVSESVSGEKNLKAWCIPEILGLWRVEPTFSVW